MSGNDVGNSVRGGVPNRDGSAVTSGIDWRARSYEDVCARHQWAIPAELNLGVLACDRHADGSGRVALISARAGTDGDVDVERTSFDELKLHSDRLMSVLKDAGVDIGDRVAVLLPQGKDNALSHLAILKHGAVSVPLSPLFRADALSHRLANSGARVVITDREHLPFVTEVRALLPRDPLVLLADGAAPGGEALWPALTRVRATPPAVRTGANDAAMLIYTSGTSGLPKGALHAHRFVPGRLPGFELLHRLEAHPSRTRPFHTPADWAWVGGLVDCVLTPWMFGCPVLAAPRRRFDAAAFLPLLQHMEVRSLFMPPTALNLLRRVAPPASRLDVSVHTAGEPLPPETLAFAQRTFQTVHELYGMTEIGATVGSSPFSPARPGSMGRPFPGHRVAVLDQRGDPVADGEVGEIAVHAEDPGMFLGYFDDTAATAARFRGPWFMSGDLARREADGSLWYQGRSDDVFNTAGYRVGPVEIEATLESHAAVARAAVVADPDSERGATVKAFVVLADGLAPSDVLAQSISSHVKQRLAVYEQPRRIVFARELPLTVTGKIRRAALRAEDADARYGLSCEPAPHASRE